MFSRGIKNEKKLKKITILILFFICTANFNEIAYAERVIPHLDWNISITLVGEVKRIYSGKETRKSYRRKYI